MLSNFLRSHEKAHDIDINREENDYNFHGEACALMTSHATVPHELIKIF